ncbi:3-oxoacyl-[acyl-carrier-protein] reductase FabG [Brevundimonas diminuta]|uniref:3-oxoacyl-ACP reductase n=1 Tax=Brevundimonas diminuta TaxID=293 RepID=UPI000207F2A3|nr:3-oxoacyl-ACP reductase [Brevundimonas diminuta]EGF94808.1 short chain dehydrogenase family protein [Brevundimonas diminuta ATCC 11568]OWR24551.1 beta-oxoacyl-ACP reductase [Brevundimonas diminuta]WQE46414.1 3-oxoacyl-ACP reductase [Brevundimonas diminuta]SPU48126.1 3-oxoacyl-[acyl-carrier-protein] reductase FabG [Brevundimonas diminuta]SUW15669.1 3-oxoacyl-[acyl-carrier-protein] reductase FabG [Brevundimonas diminuta]
MSDRYLDFANSGMGGWLTGALGLPRPLPLRRRAEAGASPVGPLLRGGGGRLSSLLHRLAGQWGVDLHTTPDEGARYGGLIFDASDIDRASGATDLYRFFHETVRRLGPCGRMVVIGRPPESMADAEGEAVQRGVEGFVRSLAKEAREGGTAQLLRLASDAEEAAASSLGFFLSPRSAYVSGQVITIGAAASTSISADRRRVLITGASRGIGAAMARLFAAEGCAVTALDAPGAQADLRALAAHIGAEALSVDITAADAAERLVEAARAADGYDAVIHNAGITRDRTLARMSATEWDSVMAVNLGAPLTLTRALLDARLIRPNGRILAVSSLSGIAGNKGQSNYALSKAAWIGAVRRLAAEAGDAITVNAIAPGFIETRMTAAIPFAIREAGRRMNSMGQGGQPIDVAETALWLAEADNGGVNGAVVRVCGQSLLGA